MRSIALPLGLGTVELAGGTCHGFTAEQCAPPDAVDITEHGGWIIRPAG